MLQVKEPRLTIGASAEFLIKLVSYSTYALLFAVTVILVISDTPSLRFVGALFALFLLDRLIHAKKGDSYVRDLAEESRKKDVNIAKALMPVSMRLLGSSFRKSLALDQSFYLVLLDELLERKNTQEALRRLQVPLDDFSRAIDEKRKEEVSLGRKELKKLLTALLEQAFFIARETNEKFIRPRNLFVTLAGVEDPSLKKLFEQFDIELSDIHGAIFFGRYRPLFKHVRRAPSVLGGFAHRPVFLRQRVMNRSWTARPTKYLDSFSTDLTALARQEKVGLLIGHKKEFEKLLVVLSRPDKPNALLIGEPGTGKSTLIAHLAFRIIKDRVPEILFDKRLISLDIGSLIANAPPEELAGRLKRMAQEIILAGNIVLFIPNIHDLFKPIGGVESFNAMNVLLPVVESNNIPLIGETYPREFKQYIERRSEFLEQFERVNVEEVTQEEALQVLIYQALILEAQYKIFITFRAIRESVRLAYRYLHEKPLPSAAADLLKESLVRADREKKKILEADTVVSVAEELSRVPIERATAEETEKLLNLENVIHRRLINQDTAVSAVSRALREYRSGLAEPGKPIARFLFVGPTGVGKTELAKILAHIQFGSRKAMERFDMSEYQDKQSIFRLIGTPDGEKSGALTDAILSHPYRLILLDEFEKAHPDVLNIFLQVFDDGRLTDSFGRTVNFENTIIIATSNAHSEYIKEMIEKGKHVPEFALDLKGKLTSYFKPELLNRFSETVVFRTLTQEEIKAIAKILIGETAELLAGAHGIRLTLDDSALTAVARLGYSPVFGARPLSSVISKNLRSVLAEKILRKEIKRGDNVRVTYERETFHFNVSG